jgi:hypothetical protein
MWLPLCRHVRGAASAAMIEALIGKKFSPGFARGMVEAFMSAHADGRVQPGHSVRLDMDAYSSRIPRVFLAYSSRIPHVFETRNPCRGGTNLSHPFAIICG